MNNILIQTSKKEEIIDITKTIQDYIKKNNILSGMVYVYCSDYTAGLLLNENFNSLYNENADRILKNIENIIQRFPNINELDNIERSKAKSNIVNKSLNLIVENNKIILNNKEGILLCEFNGPKKIEIIVKIIKMDQETNQKTGAKCLNMNVDTNSIWKQKTHF